jgi:hypothetical protein
VRRWAGYEHGVVWAVAWDALGRCRRAEKRRVLVAWQAQGLPVAEPNRIALAPSCRRSHNIGSAEQMSVTTSFLISAHDLERFFRA